jgi:predicted NodU family carbamoyl transferase
VVILGLADGLDAGASLIIDDRTVAIEPQERHDRQPRSRAFPWAAIEEVLEEAGLRNRHVDVVALAGRFSPPLVLRRRPSLRRWVNSAFSPLVDVHVFVQAMLRQTGYGALEADLAAEWLDKRLRNVGFRPQRVTTVDIHRSLAEAAYRTQPRDEVLVLTLHPMGDGSAVAVHAGVDGQLERTWNQKGFATLHVHLQRCFEAMGLGAGVDHSILAMHAARGKPDPELLEMLRQNLYVVGPRLSRRSYPLPEPRNGPVYRRLAEVPLETAAASVVENLAQTVQKLVRHHVARAGIRHVALGGDVFENPRIAAMVAELDEVESVWVHPTPGSACLPFGAAVSLAGLAPAAPSGGLGRQYHERQHERALSIAGLRPQRPTDEAAVAASILASGEPLLRFRGRAGWGQHGGGSRSVLVRGDQIEAVQRVRAALDRPHDDAVCLWTASTLDLGGSDGDILLRGKLGAAARFGSVALPVDAKFAERYPAVLTADRRVVSHQVDDDADPGLVKIIEALRAKTGCGAVACFPLAFGREPSVAVPGDAIRVWRRGRFPALLLGPFLLERS